MVANSKLSLFYDWLFFEINKDNIMNIGMCRYVYLTYKSPVEPAMLLMIHSIPKYAGLTATLMDFLIGAMEFYDLNRRDLIKQGVFNSLKIMLTKGVVTYVKLLPASNNVCR